MRFNPDLKKGQELTNRELMNIFKCATEGGMRRSHKTNSLILISNHTKSGYNDKWSGEKFLFTGEGKVGDQDINYSQNKTLANSNENGISLFLFEIFEDRRYIYQGKVKLVDSPYQEIQTDINKKERKVWIFPLKSVD